MERIQRISEQEAFPYAEKRFIRSCKFDLSKRKHQRMLELGRKVREDGLAGIDIRCIVQYYEPSVFRDGALHIDGKEIGCNFFHRIPEESIEGVYLYLITAGECLFESEEQIMEFLYADIWGTNYVDAGIEVLRDRLNQDVKRRFPGRDVKLTREFGPGYYGMTVEQAIPLFSILHGEDIGMKIKDSGLLIPQKSCSGIFFVVNDPDFDEGPECVDCVGSRLGCEFCQIRHKRELRG